MRQCKRRTICIEAMYVSDKNAKTIEGGNIEIDRIRHRTKRMGAQERKGGRERVGGRERGTQGGREGGREE